MTCLLEIPHDWVLYRYRHNARFISSGLQVDVVGIVRTIDLIQSPFSVAIYIPVAKKNPSPPNHEWSTIYEVVPGALLLSAFCTYSIH